MNSHEADPPTSDDTAAPLCDNKGSVPGPQPGRCTLREAATVAAIDHDTWVGVVANRSSGTGRGMHLVKKLVHELRRVGIHSEVADSPDARETLVEKASADPNCRCLIAVGGDGTVAALVNENPTIPITVLPAGTENLVARHFGLRRDPRYLAHLVAAGHFRPVDVGNAEGRRFMLMVGFGFDGDVVTRHHQTRISPTGGIKPTNRMAYVEPILRSSLSYRFPKITVNILDEHAPETLHGSTVFVFNLPRYALGLPFVPRAEDDDGWLDLIVFRDPGPFRAAYYLLKVALGNHLSDASVYHRRVRKLSVTSQSSIPVQIDGDPGGFILPSSREAAQAGATAGATDHLFQAGSPTRHHSIYSAEWNLGVMPSTVAVMHHPSSGPRPRKLSQRDGIHQP